MLRKMTKPFVASVFVHPLEDVEKVRQEINGINKPFEELVAYTVFDKIVEDVT
jgi:hypothetical protein